MENTSGFRAQLPAWAAAVRHGEVFPFTALGSLTRALMLKLRRRSRAGARTVGPLLHPYAARPQTHFDAHHILAEGDRLVSAALAEGGVPYVRAPRGNGDRARFVISESDVDIAAAAIIGGAGFNWFYMFGLDRGETRGANTPVQKRQLTRLLHGGGARIFLPLCSDDGVLLGADEVGCDLEVWPVSSEGRLGAPWPNAWTQSISAHQWAEANLRSDHRPISVSQRNLFDVFEPIDIVYTWVDGSDPRWLARKAQASGQQREELNQTATSWARFESNEELKYSLRSVAMYASWVRQIFIVTDGQCPPWLNLDHPQITLIDHSQIFPPDAALPTFNSHAIESRLHHIPGLSERYLYLNDDVFIGRLVAPEIFFEANGISKFFPSVDPLGVDPPTAQDLPVMSAGKQNRELIRQAFEATVTGKFKHSPHTQQKSVLLELEERYSHIFKALASSRFRQPSDVSVAAALQHLYSFAVGRAVPVDRDYFYLDISDPQAQRHLNGVLRSRSFDFFCLNSVDGDPSGKGDQRALLISFLERYFPAVSPYELTIS